METINKSQVVAALAHSNHLSLAKTNDVLIDFTKFVEEALAAKKQVQLVGFGTWKNRERKARKGRNPQTGEALTIPAHRAPIFSPGSDLRESVK